MTIIFDGKSRGLPGRRSDEFLRILLVVTFATDAPDLGFMMF